LACRRATSAETGLRNKEVSGGKKLSMRKWISLAALGAFAFIALAETAPAQISFDPAVHKLNRLEPLILGSEENSFHMEPKEYKLEVGKGYRLIIKAETDFEYAFIAPEFFRNIWIRKVEIGDIEIKTCCLDEIEFEDEGQVELFFVTVRPGTYEYATRGMQERGMVGKFIVE
jgi:uncharacterized cupredoxin-like copper-binding protein